MVTTYIFGVWFKSKSPRCLTRRAKTLFSRIAKVIGRMSISTAFFRDTTMVSASLMPILKGAIKVVSLERPPSKSRNTSPSIGTHVSAPPFRAPSADETSFRTRPASNVGKRHAAWCGASPMVVASKRNTTHLRLCAPLMSFKGEFMMLLFRTLASWGSAAREMYVRTALYAHARYHGRVFFSSKCRMPPLTLSSRCRAALAASRTAAEAASSGTTDDTASPLAIFSCLAASTMASHRGFQASVSDQTSSAVLVRRKACRSGASSVCK